MLAELQPGDARRSWREIWCRMRNSTISRAQGPAMSDDIRQGAPALLLEDAAMINVAITDFSFWVLWQLGRHH
jgi:hypothetical protein